jgi:hypothetical protein
MSVLVCWQKAKKAKKAHGPWKPLAADKLFHFKGVHFKVCEGARVWDSQGGWGADVGKERVVWKKNSIFINDVVFFMTGGNRSLKKNFCCCELVFVVVKKQYFFFMTLAALTRVVVTGVQQAQGVDAAQAQGAGQGTEGDEALRRTH